MDIDSRLARLTDGVSPPRRNRLRHLGRLGGVLVLVAGLVMPTAVFAANELPDAAALAARLDAKPTMPAIVLVSLPGCAICEIVRREQLAPLLRDPAYRDIGVFEISMRDEVSRLPLRGEWAGAADEGMATPAQLSRFLGLRMAPTVLFINRQAVLAEPLIGYPSRDFYWSFLSERIGTARQHSR